MKKLMILTAVVVFAFAACKKEALSNQKEWLMGQENDKIEEIFSITSTGTLEVVLDENSLCPNSGIGLKITRDEQLVFDQLIAEFPRTESFDVSGGNEVLITAEVQLTDSLINCVRLGNVKLRVKY